MIRGQGDPLWCAGRYLNAAGEQIAEAVESDAGESSLENFSGGQCDLTSLVGFLSSPDAWRKLPYEGTDRETYDRRRDGYVAILRLGSS